MNARIRSLLHATSSALLVVLMGAGLGAGCMGENGLDGTPPDPNTNPVCQSGDQCCKAEEIACAGDIDGKTVCTCYKSWGCDNVLKPTKCTQNPPDKPDGKGGWMCQAVANMERCVRPGTDVPPGKNGWTCLKDAGGVACSRPTNTPDGGGGWTCSYDKEFKTCILGPQPKSDAGVIKTDKGVQPKPDTSLPKKDQGTTPKPDQGGMPPGWNCYKDAVGNNICTKNGEGTPPGGGDWKCYWKNGTITCEGSSPNPPGGGGWTCEKNEFVGGYRCKKPITSGDVPGGGTWNCVSDTTGTKCTQPPPPKKPGDECVVGQKMWCDGALYCGYGTVDCGPDGKWKTKINPKTGQAELDCWESASGHRPNTVCACYFFFFNKDCCETPDCIVPPGTVGQICPQSKGTYCDYCTPSKPECKAVGAKCIVTPKAETFCGQDCTGGKACPAGSMCVQVQLSQQNFWQCVPLDQSCYY